MEPWGLTTGPKKTPHPLGCQEHCKCGVSAPAIFTVMPNSPTPHPSHSLDNGAAEPPTLPATMSAHVGWQQWQRGVPDGEACCRMGLLLSVWAMSQVITSTQLIHHAPQTDTNKEDTFLPPLPLPHSSPLEPFLFFLLSMWAKAWRKKNRLEFRLSLTLGGHGSARRKRQVVFWPTSLSINLFLEQNDGQAEGFEGRQSVSKMFMEK